MTSSQVIAQIPSTSSKGLVTCPSMTVRSVTGQDLKVIGKINTNLEICGHTINFIVYVAEGFHFDCLLGTDILSALGIVIDFATKTISFREKSAPFSTTTPPALCIVRVKETVVVPARSEICLLLKTTSQFDGFPGIVEPSLCNKTGVSKLHVARTASLPEKCLLSVRVLNLASEPETIYKNTKVGKFEPFENTETVAVIEPIISKLDNTESSVNQPEVKASATTNVESTMTVPIDLSSTELTLEQKHELQKLINEFGDIFAVDKTDFGFTDLVQHRIDVGDHSPIKSKPYRVPFSQRPIIEEQIKTMLEKNHSKLEIINDYYIQMIKQIIKI